ncbi:SDR family oxidoreductase [Guptibacillus algicola]|uniref:SDR family oxidoreductase n=1 Tax=Guptibacillus algicola TaxID=225844 RepID=UPI001CD486E5|nr:SDR family oxidoreductase [Alkalihalobacillus algicola]MCA0987768.1 SDR family oxidoreductase [Alkalihalobacillus algicola]
MRPDNKQTNGQPAQHQNHQPGSQEEMNPKPLIDDWEYKGSGKLTNKVALITGGDSGIGEACALAYAKEGAKLAIVYLDEEQDAQNTKKLIENEGSECLLLAGDIGDESFCKSVIDQVIEVYGRLDILINNAAEQHPQKGIEDITAEQLEKTYRTNVFSMFHLTKAALPHLKKGSTIINTSSITGYEGNEQLIDYSTTKGAITAFTRSMAKSLVGKGIRVNSVAPGPIWTPLIPSTFSSDKVKDFGTNTPMGRPGQPEELAAAYVLLGSDDSSYMTGQTIHINGGQFMSS